jgi:hypothetical protein
MSSSNSLYTPLIDQQTELSSFHYQNPNRNQYQNQNRNPQNDLPPQYEERSPPSQLQSQQPMYNTGIQPSAPVYQNYPTQPMPLSNTIYQSTVVQPTIIYPTSGTTNFTIDILRLEIRQNRCSRSFEILENHSNPFVTYPNLTLHATPEEFSASINRIMFSGMVPWYWQASKWLSFFTLPVSFFLIFVIPFFLGIVFFVSHIIFFLYAARKSATAGYIRLCDAVVREKFYYAQPRQGRLPLLWYVDGGLAIVVSVWSQSQR